jgi:hypothetical protein
MFAKVIDGIVALSPVALDNEWIKVTSFPSNRKKRDKWTLSGSVVSAPETTTAEKIAAIRASIDLHIETVAKSAGDFGFDSVLSAVSYVGGNPENINVIYGTAIFNYRQACYDKARDLLTAWKSGGKELTPEQAVKNMPLWTKYKPEL